MSRIEYKPAPMGTRSPYCEHGLDCEVCGAKGIASRMLGRGMYVTEPYKALCDACRRAHLLHFPDYPNPFEVQK